MSQYNNRLLIDATKALYKAIQNIEIVAMNCKMLGKSSKALKEINTLLVQLKKPYIELYKIIIKN